MQDPEAAAEEIYRMADEKQYIGVFIDNTGPNPPLGDPRYDVVYRAAEDKGLPVSYHAYDSGFIVDFPRQKCRSGIILRSACVNTSICPLSNND